MARTTVKERVARGAALLDRIVPGWEKRIDLEKLDLASCEFCVCGQLANTSRSRFVRERLEDPRDGYYVFLDYIKSKRKTDGESYEISDEFGFSTYGSFSYLNRQWKNLIEERVSA